MLPAVRRCRPGRRSTPATRPPWSAALHLPEEAHRGRRGDHRDGRGRAVADPGRRQGRGRADQDADHVRDTARRPRARSTRSTRRTPGVATELPEAIEPLTELANLPNPAAELETNPELDAAAAKAPKCQEVQTCADQLIGTVGGSDPAVIERVFYGTASCRSCRCSPPTRGRPASGDLAGLLCGPGQILRFGAGDQARLSIVLADPTGAARCAAACAAAGIDVDPVRTESGATALRSAFRCDLVELATAWTRGAVKAVPPGMAAGRPGVTAVGAGRRPARRARRVPAGAGPARPADAPAAGRGGHPAGHPAGPGGPRTSALADQRRPPGRPARRAGRAGRLPGWTRSVAAVLGAHARLDGLVTLARHRSGPRRASRRRC